ncbi:dihydropteroate synthase [Sphaerimonospora cavernae]|uniref:Dihydropteroate synthase n=1 Tax=Sphaerimonospora cavernae TaxID=1740611 RepID=A0ABV6U3M7_9ACTN
MTGWSVPGMPEPGRCLVMGVVNVTPDSFSDGGRWFDPDIAIRHGLDLVAEGADIVDVGGESTRPGAARVSLEEELRRIEPVIRALSAEGVPVSVDTMRAEVAEVAVAAGARLVNDVSGGLADPDMPRVVAATGVPYVVMHWRGHSRDMDSRALYHDVVTEVAEELRKRVDSVLAVGVGEEQIILDPGLGFSKQAKHNWAVLAGIDTLNRLGRPLVIGASRKRFLGRLLADAEGTPRPFERSDDATLAVTALAARAGAWCVRVHKVGPNADAVRVAGAWLAAERGDAGANADRREPDEGRR